MSFLASFTSWQMGYECCFTFFIIIPWYPQESVNTATRHGKSFILMNLISDLFKALHAKAFIAGENVRWKFLFAKQKVAIKSENRDCIQIMKIDRKKFPILRESFYSTLFSSFAFIFILPCTLCHPLLSPKINVSWDYCNWEILGAIGMSNFCVSGWNKIITKCLSIKPESHSFLCVRRWKSTLGKLFNVECRNWKLYCVCT